MKPFNQLPDPPQEFRERMLAVFGQAGRTYLEGLGETVFRYTREWGLTVQGPAPNLSYNYVLFVTCADGTEAVLKISVPTEDSRNEILATTAYGGDGCARLLRAVPEDGVQLIERLSPGVMLRTVRDERKAAEQFCGVWRRIRRPLPDGAEIRPVGRMGLEAFAKYRASHPGGGPVPVQHVALAEECFRWLDEHGRTELLHGDLHHQNILLDEERGWMAIDPHGYAGDPACDLAPYLYNELEGKPLEETLALRTSIMLARLPVGRERLFRACIAMTVLSACWNAEEGNLPGIRLQNRMTDWHRSQLT
ncbi:aminoglycoside phosphotransferase family protein [Bhargavaea massiliensis]|uniref:aminoglycoside phosphotransferase family protein n=1 Tax=Bhargavaea massiliensis TaxID=2697500 RepID=UPI001BCDCD23|nr:aminoglycoside phosphotransferase family protein [Bhargavaea massiliensis]